MGQFEKMIRHDYKELGWTLARNNARKVLSNYYNDPEPDHVKLRDYNNSNYVNQGT